MLQEEHWKASTRRASFKLHWISYNLEDDVLPDGHHILWQCVYVWEGGGHKNVIHQETLSNRISLRASRFVNMCLVLSTGKCWSLNLGIKLRKGNTLNTISNFVKIKNCRQQLVVFVATTQSHLLQQLMETPVLFSLKLCISDPISSDVKHSSWSKTFEKFYYVISSHFQLIGL